MEPLSAVLRGMNLKGSIYAAWELRAPWGMGLPEAPFASFHWMEQGSSWLRAGEDVLPLEAGERVVLFGGQAHQLLSSRAASVTTARAAPTRRGGSSRRGPGCAIPT
ncbi:cupin domain-containing protein [Myxococcus sp. CA040A]|uniref:cupin domain-containing protein n=1 Tax=Myxococcus sp. CA040A TaxID=2741738 RepID=UPI00157AEB8E|nr:cupin domain-containing protein [Myxococcus sp. CA040A]NTX04597.1 cupin domain-containing protein [Myxococcus sp. CA040A]